MSFVVFEASQSPARRMRFNPCTRESRDVRRKKVEEGGDPASTTSACTVDLLPHLFTSTGCHPTAPRRSDACHSRVFPCTVPRERTTVGLEGSLPIHELLSWCWSTSDTSKCVSNICEMASHPSSSTLSRPNPTLEHGPYGPRSTNGLCSVFGGTGRSWLWCRWGRGGDEASSHRTDPSFSSFQIFPIPGSRSSVRSDASTGMLSHRSPSRTH